MRTRRLAAPALVATLLGAATVAPNSPALASADAPASSAVRSIDPQNTGYILFTYSPLRRSAGAKNGFEGPGDLRVIAPDGSGNWALTTGPANDFDGVFAPGSQQVAFSSDRANRKAGITDLYVIDIEGTGLKRLTYGADTRGVSWSPDGKRLVVHDKKGLLIVDPLSGKSMRLLRTPKGSTDTGPIFTPDGTQVVFTRSLMSGGKALNQAIWAVSLDGSGARKLFGGEGKLKFSSQPAMSSDGFTLAWVVRDKHGSSIWMGDLFNGLMDNVRRFAKSNDEFFEGPTFAPDGSQLAVSLNFGNATRGAELLIYNVGDKKMTRLYTIATGNLAAPNWTD
jgi:Tol biopolymer transport system component